MAPVLFLTIHKTASSFLNTRLLPSLAADLGLPHCDPFGVAKRGGLSKRSVMVDDYAGEPSLLGPVRQPLQVLDPALFDGWRKILLLRDPRDVLVSWHFYMQRKAPQPAIDEHVLAMMPTFRDRYDDYHARFAARPNLMTLRYEDMIGDWLGFCREIATFVGASPDWTAQAEMLQDEVGPTDEDPGSHKRQVGAGDHLRKLSPETIATLDRELAPVLEWLGYPACVSATPA